MFAVIYAFAAKRHHTMLQVTNIEKSYGKQLLFDGVGFTVNPRERVGLVGRNGHGKSTLFRMILGEEHQDDGTITTPAGYTIGHLSQHIHFTEETVLEEACLSLPTNEDHIDETYKAEAILPAWALPTMTSTALRTNSQAATRCA
jgi:ATP-binding cassette subfamily F protein 3